MTKNGLHPYNACVVQAIDPHTGFVELSTAYPTWRGDKDHIWHLVGYIKSMFYEISTAAKLNPEASHLYVGGLTRRLATADPSVARIKCPFRFNAVDGPLDSARDALALRRVLHCMEQCILQAERPLYKPSQCPALTYVVIRATDSLRT